jgi:hypothetical protein
MPSLEIHIKGVQHYVLNGSKNSADIVLALDVFADLLKRKTTHVAVMSDDSDYASLFAAIKQENIVTENSKIPFKWLMTNRLGTRSQLLTDFFPAEYIHTIICPNNPKIEIEDEQENLPSENTSPEPEEEKIAKAIIQNLPIGLFKSTDCKKIVVKNFPKHHLSKADSATFGTQFLKLLWPILEKHGVKLDSSNRKPRRYEMTPEAKKSLA